MALTPGAAIQAGTGMVDVAIMVLVAGFRNVRGRFSHPFSWGDINGISVRRLHQKVTATAKPAKTAPAVKKAKAKGFWQDLKRANFRLLDGDDAVPM